jgi:hypothetical protein
MAKFKVKLGLKDLVISALISLARLIVSKMTLNPTFPAPDPALPAITTAADNLETAKALVDAKKNELAVAVADQDAKETALQDLLTKEAKYVELKSDGDQVKIESAGMSAYNTESGPVGTLPKVVDLQLTHGDEAGEVDCQWHPVKKRTNYTVQTTLTDPNDPASVWVTYATAPTKSSISIKDQTSGQRIWIRVCANGSDGPGAFSDPNSIIVP